MVCGGRFLALLLRPLLGWQDPDLRLYARDRFGGCARALREPGFQVRPVARFGDDRDLESVALMSEACGARSRERHTAW